MQEILSLVATVGVLIALSGILPVATVVSAIAQEARPNELTRAMVVPEATRADRAKGAEAIDIDALTLDSDFSVFMRPDCPQALRLQALRKLWTLLPPAHLDENPAI